MRWSFHERAPGQAIAFAAVAIAAMVGMVAFAVDAGVFWEARRELQGAADSAALAGITRIPGYPPDGNFQPQHCSPDTTTTPQPCDADDAASKFLDRDLANATRLCISSSPPARTVTAGLLNLHEDTTNAATVTGFVYTLTVTLECPVPHWFGGILDLTTANVRASATAVVGSRKEGRCLSPFGVVDANGAIDQNGNSENVTTAPWQDFARNGYGYSFGQLVQLFTNNAGGNFQALELDLINGNNHQIFPYNNELVAWLSGYICPPNQIVLGVTQVPTKTGVNFGPVVNDGLGPGKLNANPPQPGRGLVDCGATPNNPVCSQIDPNGNAYNMVCPDNINSGFIAADGLTWTGKQSVCLTDVVFVNQYINSGSTPVTPVGFGLFFIQGQNGNGSGINVWGYFLKKSQPSSDVTGFVDATDLTIRLIR
jgi:Flp pilus assembly protein TadG